jgi:hypothetical protein
MFFLLSKALLFLLSPFNWFIAAVGLHFFWPREPWKKRFKWLAIILFLFFNDMSQTIQLLLISRPLVHRYANDRQEQSR